MSCLKNKNTQWRRNITTEERLTLTLKLVRILYNLLSHHQNS